MSNESSSSDTSNSDSNSDDTSSRRKHKRREAPLPSVKPPSDHESRWSHFMYGVPK